MKSIYHTLQFVSAVSIGCVAHNASAQTVVLPNPAATMNRLTITAPAKLPKGSYAGTAKLATADGRAVSSAMIVFFIGGSDGRGTQKLIGWTNSQGTASVTLPGYGETGASTVFLQAVSSATAGNASALSEPIKIVK